MARIGIRAPLEHREATWAVAAAAERLSRLGHECSWFPPNKPREYPVVYGWSGHTRTCGSLADWLEQQDWVIWVEPRRYEVLTAARRGVANLLLWTPCGQLPSCALFWQLFDEVAAPSRSIYDGLRQSRLCPRVHYAPWFGADAPVPRREPVWHNQLLVPVDAVSARHWGPFICYLVERLIVRRQCTAVLTIHGSWPSSCQAALRDVMKQHASRLEVLRRPSRSAFLAACATSDLVVAPTVSSVVGWPALEALWLGVPAVTLRVPPFTELITSGQEGYTIPCSQIVYADGFVKAELDRTQLWDDLEQVVEPERVQAWLANQPWSSVSERHAAFREWTLHMGWGDIR